MASLLKLKVCELEAPPVLGYLNRMAQMKQQREKTPDVFDPWPAVCLGYTHAIMMTTKDVFPMYQRRKPYFHFITSSMLEKICPQLHKKIFFTYLEHDPDWKPFITPTMRTTDYVLTPTPDTFAELADTARVLCLVNAGEKKKYIYEK